MLLASGALLTGFSPRDHLLAQGPANAATAENSFQVGRPLGLIDFTGDLSTLFRNGTGRAPLQRPAESSR